MIIRKQLFLLWAVTFFTSCAAAVNASGKNFTCSKVMNGLKGPNVWGGQCVVYVRNETGIEGAACRNLAKDCAQQAEDYGYSVGDLPKLNSILVMGPWTLNNGTVNEAGHVAIVTGIATQDNTQVTVRDSNWYPPYPVEYIHDHVIDTDAESYGAIHYIYCEEDLKVTAFKINNPSTSICESNGNEPNLSVAFTVRNISGTNGIDENDIKINNIALAIHKASDGAWIKDCWTSGEKTLTPGTPLGGMVLPCTVSQPGKYKVVGKVNMGSNRWYDLRSEEFTVSDCSNVVRLIAPVLLEDTATPGTCSTGPQTVMWQGKEWQRCDDGKAYSWEDAVSYCENLVLDDHSDWRLPSKSELSDLRVCSTAVYVWQPPEPPPADPDWSWCNAGSRAPTIDPSFQCNVSGYWSSTSHASTTSLAWYVSFINGLVDYNNKVYHHKYVRCVRGGQ